MTYSNSGLRSLLPNIQYNANQISFLRAVQSVFLQKRRLKGALARFGKNAVDRFFSDDEVDDLLAFTELLAA